MKKKILVMVLLALFLSPLLMATVQAGQLPFRSSGNNFRNNNSQDDSSQGKTWLSWRNPTSQDSSDSLQTYSNRWINFPLTGDEASLQWIRDQIDTVLTKLEQEGITLPGDMDQKLNSFFTAARDSLAQTQSQGSLPLSNLLKGPDYNMTCNYDPKTQVMDFIANRVLKSDNSLTSIDLSGSLNPTGPWDMAFAIVNSISNRDRGSQRKAYFQKPFSYLNSSSTDTSSAAISSASDTSKDPQEDNSTSKTNHSRDFTFIGEICQDGLVSLYLNPSQTINLNFMGNASYATQTGIEILQDAETRTGKFYMDILDNSVSGADDKLLYHWEKALW